MTIIHVIILIIILIIFFVVGFQLNQLNKQYQRKNKRLENELNKLKKDNSKLVADNALFEINQLKFQLQPHALLGLLANIKRTSNKLNKGLDSLSETLDYILYRGNNNHLVSIKDEIKFMEDYLNLNELFLSQINCIQRDFNLVNLNSIYYSSPCIPHLITAYFIENAFKHGDVNHSDFLRIKVIHTDNTFELKIENQINSKTEVKKGGLGIKNMNKRLELLLNEKYTLDNNILEQRYYSSLIIQLC